ncbi:uncharacterized protein Tco025E_10121, partial [Trypanosoma conorhini]
MLLSPSCRTPMTSVPEVVLIPPFYVTLAASVLYALCNAAFNYANSGHGKFAKTLEKWGRLLWLTRRVEIAEARELDELPIQAGAFPIETDRLMGSGDPSGDAAYNTFLQPLPDVGRGVVDPPSLPAKVLDNALLDSFQSVRLEAQRMVFVYSPTYMIVASAKSLVMLVVLQYHFDYEGGWNRLVVCSAANVMGGLLTPVLEYAARWLLPLDHECGGLGVVVEPEEPTDSVLIVEVLGHISRLELEDLGTVLIQGSAFIVFGAVLLPALLVFCLTGMASFLW